VTGRRDVLIGVGGNVRVVRLSEEEAAALAAGLAPFIAAARKTGRLRQLHRPRTLASRRRAAQIRAWARAEGIEVAPLGRIPGAVITGWEERQ
jgi:hypothetical protein